jgi:hypothetical protein
MTGGCRKFPVYVFPASSHGETHLDAFAFVCNDSPPFCHAEVDTMFCSNCGTKADGNFCAACGARLQASQDASPEPERTGSWADELVYEQLLQYPEVRERIAQAGRRSQSQMSGENLLAIFDAVVPTGISFEKLTVALLPIYDRMGIKTGKTSEMILSVPAGRAIVATLCAMASQGYEMNKVDQTSDGCVLTALLPSTLWTNRGDLIVSIQQGRRSLRIHATTNIPGQLFDWGKSTRLLRDFFGSIRQELTAIPWGHVPGKDVA